MSAPTIKPEDAVSFLCEAARYFLQRPTGGEDAAFWANVGNAEKCIRIAELIESQRATQSIGGEG